MASNVAYPGPENMPSVIPVFPLPGALLLPRGEMPLNIFEPRYLAMIDHALSHDRLIGMIQPEATQGETGPVALSQVGCVGRITQLSESGDGRYLVTLTGIARFRTVEEVHSDLAFRRMRVDWEPFALDYLPRHGEDAVDRDAVIGTLRRFSKANNLDVDWDSVKEAPNEALVNALCMMSPFGVREKQALLEASDLKTRGEILVALTEIELAKAAGGGDTKLQ
jgi:uncharacterized protein